MNTLSRILIPALLLGIITAFSSCTSNTGSDDTSNFDRSAMLQNYSSNIIIPAYHALDDSLTNLQNSATTFSEAPTAQNLQALQQDLKNTRLAWQHANLFQFGPAEMQVLRSSVNTYPTDTDKINANIESGDYNLGTLDNQDAAGFPALGYLLHGTGDTEAEIIAQYTTESNAQNRMTYLLDNVSFIHDKVEAVTNEWSENGGDYEATFLSEDNAGTDVGSSIGMLVNALVLHYEQFLRDGKIGIPSGVRSAGIPRPTATEAYYGGYSLELAIANQQAFWRLFQGTGLDNADGLGLEENLEALGSNELADQINTDIEASIAALNTLSDPLSDQIDSNNDPVLNAFEEMQQVVALVKADMTSVLGVTITFQDNDGD